VVAAGGVLGPASDALRFATSAGSQNLTRCCARREFTNFFETKPEGEMVETTREALVVQPVEMSKPQPSLTARVLGMFCFEEPQRTEGHAGLGWGPMSQSAARLRLPA